MHKVCTDYIVESNSILEKFAKHMDLELDDTTTRNNWIGYNRLPWMVWIGDYFFSLDNIVDILEYNIFADIVFDWYYKSLDDYENGREMRTLQEFIENWKKPKPLKSYRKAEKALHKEFEDEFHFLLDNNAMLDVLYYSIPHYTVLEYVDYEHKDKINITSFAKMREDMSIEDITISLLQK